MHARERVYAAGPLRMRAAECATAVLRVSPRALGPKVLKGRQGTLDDASDYSVHAAETTKPHRSSKDCSSHSKIKLARAHRPVPCSGAAVPQVIRCECPPATFPSLGSYSPSQRAVRCGGCRWPCRVVAHWCTLRSGDGGAEAWLLRVRLARSARVRAYVARTWDFVPKVSDTWRCIALRPCARLGACVRARAPGRGSACVPSADQSRSLPARERRTGGRKGRSEGRSECERRKGGLLPP